MTRTSPPQVAFSSGEISPLLHQRFDYQRYQTGLAACRGFLPMAEGGVTRAPGTWYRGHAQADAAARLVPFIFAANDAVVLEFTPLRMRVWRYGQLVLGGGAPYELVTPYPAESLSRLRWVQSADVLYLCDGLRPIQRLARYALDNWTISEQILNSGPFQLQNLDDDVVVTASARTGAVTLTASADLFSDGDVDALLRLRLQHSVDVPMWRADMSATIGDRVRHDGNGYRLVSWDNSSGVTGSIVPVWDEDNPAPTVWRDNEVEWTRTTPGDYATRANSSLYKVGDRARFGGSLPLLSWEVSAIYRSGGPKSVGINAPNHTDGDLLTEKGGPVWRFEDDGQGVVRIDAVTDPRHASATVLRDLPQSVVVTGTYRWAKGAWSQSQGYPSCLELYDQRLVAGATPAEPRAVWFSAVGDFADFLDGTEADEAFAYTVAGSGSMNRVINIYSGSGGLHIFALGEEFSSRAESRNQVIGPTNAVFARTSGIGSSDARPIGPQGDPIFISRDRRRVFVSSYSLDADTLRATEVSRPSGHLGADKFEEIVWQGVPLSTAWLRTGSGELVSMVYDPAEEILGWAPQPVAGGIVESMAVTPAADGSLDVLTMVVRRTINGADVRMIEEQAVPFGPLAGEIGVDQANHLFAALRFAPDPASREFSLPHLIGQTVHAWTSEGDIADLPVSPIGGVTLPWPVDWAVIGLFDASHMVETLDVTAQAPDGSTLGRNKRLQDRGGIGLHATAQLRCQAVERDFSKPEKASGWVNLVDRPAAAKGSSVHSGVSSKAPPSGQATAVSYRFTPVGGAPATITAMVPFVQEAGR